MNPQDPLAALHPLREPMAIAWWPLAPGWWLLIVLVIFLTTVALYYFYKRYRSNAYRRQALKQLRELHCSWQSTKDSNEFLSATNALLKSVALRAFPRWEVAAKNGIDWVGFLNQTAAHSSSAGFSEEFALAHYQQESNAIDCEELNQAASLWISAHRGGR